MKCERCGYPLNRSNVYVLSISDEEIIVECPNCIEPITYKKVAE